MTTQPARPYTEADLAAEAVLLGVALSRPPSVADLERSLPGQYIPSRRDNDGDGPTYGDLLDADGITTLARAVHERIAGGEVRAAALEEAIPAWEAMYEPGNVSDYLIGYANSEAAAKGAAEAWLRSEKSDPGRLEWVPAPLMAVRQHDEWFELINHDPELGACDTGINVRHRLAAAARPDDTTGA